MVGRLIEFSYKSRWCQQFVN